MLIHTPSFAQLNKDNADKNDKLKNAEKLLNNSFSFMENKGQWPEEVLFMANTKSLRAWITKKAMIFEQFEENKNASIDPYADTLSKKEIKTHVTGLEFINSKQVKIKKNNPIVTKYNFLIGNDESKHAKDVSAFEDVKIENIYDGIDIKYYFDNGELRYDYIVKPNADPNQIELEIKGGDNFRIENGELLIETSLNPIIKKELFAYQNDKLDNTKKNKVNSQFTLNGNKLKFNIGNYDKSQELIIDPITQLYYKSINSSYTTLNDLKIDLFSNLLFVGSTSDNNFPMKFGNSNIVGERDLVVGYFDENLNHKWSCFYGGTLFDEGLAIETINDINNISNKVYIVGYTSSNNLPIDNQNGNYYNNTLYGLMSNFFVVFEYSDFQCNKVYSSYLKNSNGSDYYLDKYLFMADIKVSNNGNVYISTNTNTTITPSFVELNQITSQNHSSSTSNVKGCLYGFQPIMNGPNLNYNCIFSSLFSGNNITFISDLDIDNQNNLYIAGNSKSTNNTINLTRNSYRDDLTPSFGYKYVYFSKLNFNTNLTIQYNSKLFEETIPQQGSLVLSNVEDLLYYNNRIVIAGYVRTPDNFELKNSFDNLRNPGPFYNTPYLEGFISVIELNSNNNNDLIYSSYFGNELGATLYPSSNIVDIDYDWRCDKISFIGFNSSPLANYAGTLNHPFLTSNWGGHIMVGELDINLVGVNTLTQLAYFCTNDIGTPSQIKGEYPYAISYRPMNGNLVTLSGIVGVLNQNFLIRELEKTGCSLLCACPATKDSWITLTMQKNDPACPGQCKVIANIEIPTENLNCFTHFSYESFKDEIKDNTPNTKLTLANFVSTFSNICITPGMTYKLRIKLYRGIEDPNPCIITKQATCPVAEPPGVACVPDCPEDNWSPVQTIYKTLTGCSGNGEICQLAIHYVSRKACNDAFQDIQIVGMEKKNLNANNGGDCSCYTDDMVYKQAIQEIIAQNRMNFTPKNEGDPCSETWRVSQASCWAKWLSYYDSPNPEYYAPRLIVKYRPCNSYCCMRRFRVCIEPGGSKTITDLGQIGQTISCENIPVPNDYDLFVSACEFKCDMLANISSTFSKESVENNYEDDFDFSDKNLIVSLNAFNTNELLNIEFEKINFDNLVVKVYNLNGIEVINTNYNKNEINNPISIDISKLQTSTYVYEIIIDGRKIHSNKFIKY